MRYTVVMVATSYPRFPGDTIGTFMEPIAKGVAARGHTVHLVAPWHPRLDRRPVEDGVHFHFFPYAPVAALNVFGYSGALRADVSLRGAAWIAAPLAVGAGVLAARRVARRVGAHVMHGHWVIPGGAIAHWARPRLPLVVSLHGSDVYVAERHASVGRVARSVFRHAGWTTACSADLRDRALRLGASPERSDVVPYGVNADEFRPDPVRRRDYRARLGIAADAPVLFAAGRFVRKKGFEYLLEAVAQLAVGWPSLTLILGGAGDLEGELVALARSLGVASRVAFPGVLSHGDVARALAAADLAIVPSVRDDAGNVDGLPNVVMEALASGTALVTTTAGGIGAVTRHGETAWHVRERSPEDLAAAVDALLRQPAARAALGSAARADVLARHTWAQVAARMEAAYDEAVGARRGA
ncbi:MAG: glycosyltransferase [Vicinamibacterales bacterium]